MTTHAPKPILGALDDLIRLIETLRGDNGCPWDRKQTPRSILVYLIEEIYELSEAVESNQISQIREELGDVLFQVFFIARLFEEAGQFDLGSVARENTRKMIRRHPHVFGGDRLESTESIRKRWHEIKREEKQQHSPASILDSVPVKLPALMRAYRVSERAAAAGLQWSEPQALLQKAEKDLAGFRRAAETADTKAASTCFGELLFTLIGLARLHRLHPETILVAAIQRFVGRFKKLEALAAEEDRTIDTFSPEELERLWAELQDESD